MQITDLRIGLEHDSEDQKVPTLSPDQVNLVNKM